MTDSFRLNEVFGLGAAFFSAHAMAGVTVYSGQHKAGTEAVAAAFTEATGIPASLVNC